MPRPFKSDLVIEEKISEAVLRAYHVGFDQDQFRLQPLVDVIRKVIPEFALGYHEGPDIPMTEIVEKLREAAEIVYQTDKYQKRGEFGELILHLLLRDFCGSIPLISKIYFKDTPNATVHGFDGVQITLEDHDEKKMWLGESKLYTNGEQGVRDLAKDLEQHIKADYLKREFTLIARKLPKSVPEIEYWRELMNKHQTLDKIYSCIVLPMVCTYSSEIFIDHTAETEAYLDAFTEEAHKLLGIFQNHIITTNVEVILMLLPVPDKNELNDELHKRLKRMQTI